MTGEIDPSATSAGRVRVAALLFAAAPAAAALMAFTVPTLTVTGPVAGSAGTVGVQTVAGNGDPDPCKVTVEWPGANKVPNCAGD
jgi:hypothetical protein